MQNLKFLFVNFSQEEEFQLRNEMEALYKKFSSDSIMTDGKITNAHLSKDYDIVFVNVDQDSKDSTKSFSEIRSKFPLAELIYMTKEESYELAINAIRIGARDILTFPIDRESLNVSIKTAYSYRHAYFLSEKYSKLLAILNHFGDIRKIASHDDLYRSSERYVIQHFPVKNISVFTYHFEKKVERYQYGPIREVKLDRKIYSDLSTGEDKYIVKDHHVVLPFYANENECHFIIFQVPEKYEFYKVDLVFEQLSSVMRNSYEYLLKRVSEEKMSDLAHTDDVTGLYNQRKLYKDIDRNMAVSNESNEPFSLVFLDLDNFKNINDGHGHLVGSNLLLQVAQVIRQVIRDTDYIYRYGGDEFVIILPTAHAKDAKKIGERLLKIIKTHDFKADDDKTFNLSTSIGIAEYPRDAKNREEILKIADKMMYEAKQTGRGRVCLIDEIFKTG